MAAKACVDEMGRVRCAERVSLEGHGAAGRPRLGMDTIRCVFSLHLLGSASLVYAAPSRIEGRSLGFSWPDAASSWPLLPVNPRPSQGPGASLLQTQRLLGGFDQDADDSRGP